MNRTLIASVALFVAMPVFAEPEIVVRKPILACASKEDLRLFDRATKAQDFDTTFKLAHEHRCRDLKMNARVSVVGREDGMAKVQVRGETGFRWVSGGAITR